MSPRSPRARPAVLAALLALLVAGVYLQTLRFGFVFDDYVYIADNRLVRAGLTWGGIRAAFHEFQLGFWHPLTLLSHMLDATLFGLNPAGHHLTSLVLHTANTVLCFLVLRAATGATFAPALAAALFGLHPLRAESVAYISERKDVLSVCLWFLTMAAWLRHLRRPSRLRWLAAAGVFALGLMAKPMLVTLPFALLLLDYWPLGRLRPDRLRSVGSLLAEKAPLLLLSAVASTLAYAAESRYGALSPVEPFALPVRLLNALFSYGWYLLKTVWPSGLAAFYPHPGPAIPAIALVASATVLVAVSLWSLVVLRRLPYVFVGWSWYLGTLVPVIGLVQIGDMGRADRFSYVPAVGLAIVAAFGAASFARSGPRAARVAPAAALLAVLGLALLSTLQVAVWRDGVRLFRHTVAATTNNPLARYNLGVALAQAGRFPEAEREFRRLLDEDPGYLPAYHDLSAIARLGGRTAEAVDLLAQGLRRGPGSPQLHYDLGLLLGSLGRTDEAIGHLEETVRLRPRWAGPYNDLGILLAGSGRFDEAERRFSEALTVDPGDENAPYNLSHLEELRRQAPAPAP